MAESLWESLREYADAVDKDRGFATGLTDTMRDAADEMVRCQKRLDKQVEFHKHWRERAISAEQALGLYGQREAQSV